MPVTLSGLSELNFELYHHVILSEDSILITAVLYSAVVWFPIVDFHEPLDGLSNSFLFGSLNSTTTLAPKLPCETNLKFSASRKAYAPDSGICV
jgi:hypothetical protein